MGLTSLALLNNDINALPNVESSTHRCPVPAKTVVSPEGSVHRIGTRYASGM